MKKQMIILAILSVTSICLITADDIKCDCTFSTINWIQFGRQKTCSVRRIDNVLVENSTIVSINGNDCKPDEPNTEVSFFYVLAKTVYYIPKGLNVVFANLTGMRFELTKMKHISKENLRPFPQLLMFASVGNQIQFIEKDLFMYTTKIQYVSLRANRITYIDSKVFDVIRGSLVQFWIDGTAIACGLTNAASKTAVEKVLDKLPNSTCADIVNAPPLYSMWLKLKEEAESGGKCETEIAAKEAECEAEKTALEEKHQKDIEENTLMCQCIVKPTDPKCSNLTFVQ